MFYDAFDFTLAMIAAARVFVKKKVANGYDHAEIDGRCESAGINRHRGRGERALDERIS